MSEQRVSLTFQRWQLDQPVTYRLVKDFDLVINILQAKITAEEGRSAWPAKVGFESMYFCHSKANRDRCGLSITPGSGGAAIAASSNFQLDRSPMICHLAMSAT